MNLFRRLLIFSVLISTALDAGENIPLNDPDQVITAEQIGQAGLNRLSDILFLLEDWDISTIDGYSWQATANGLTAPGRQNWLVFVDDQQIQLAVFDNINLNRLPLSVDEVERVEVYSTPRMSGAGFSETGSIHFYTRKAKEGLSYLGAMTYGNETGDPGPYRYTKYRTSNVDRIAADGSNIISYKRKNWLVRAGYTDQVFYPTDTRVLTRNRRISDGVYPRINMDGYHLSLALEGSGGWHTVTVGGSSLEDLFFFKPYGREVPLVNNMDFSGIRGAFKYDEKTRFEYRTGLSTVKLDQRKNTFDIDFDWKQVTSSADLQVVYRDEKNQGTFGMGYESLEAKSGYLPADKKIDKTKIFGSINRQFSPRCSTGIEMLMAIIDEKTALKAAIRNRLQLNEKHFLKAGFSFSQRFFAEDNSYWKWAQKGSGLLDDLGVIYTLDDEYGKSQRLSGDVSWHYAAAKYALTGAVFYRNFSNLYLEDQVYSIQQWEQAFSGPLTVSPAHNGQLAGTKIQLRANPGSGWTHNIVYRYQETLSGSALFKEQQRIMPGHTVKYRVRYHPLKSFSVWAMFSYYSKTRWADFELVEEQSSGDYKSSLSSKTNLDIAVQKTLWKQRLFGRLLFRNVFNSEQIYHPAGAALNLRFYVQLGLRLDSII